MFSLDIAEWDRPKGGMFVWVKIPSVKNTFDLAMKDCLKKGIFVLPGVAFHYNSEKPSQYVRLCYSYATSEEMEKVRLLINKRYFDLLYNKNVL